MPELPEVEVVVRSLRPYLVGKRIEGVERLREKSLPQGLDEVADWVMDARIAAINRRAKYIDMTLDNGWHILTHLKMTGQLIYVGQQPDDTAGGGHPTDDWRQQLPGKHTRLVWTLADDAGARSHLYFNDQRVFGWMRVLSAEEIAAQYYHKLGPDANTPGFTVAYLRERVKNRRVPIKQAILDNAIVCGLGNIYAAEACFAAGVSPLRPAGEVPLQDLKKIVIAAQRILAEAVAAGGTTFDGKYVDGEGKSGAFVEQLQVYGRDGQACTRCGEKLALVRMGGRATVYCPRCQK